MATPLSFPVGLSSTTIFPSCTSNSPPSSRARPRTASWISARSSGAARKCRARLTPLSSRTREGCLAAIKLNFRLATSRAAPGTSCLCIVPEKSRRSAPCCPATQKAEPWSRRSMSAMGRPLIRGRAPPAARPSVFSKCTRPASTLTWWGWSVISSSVPSKSRKNAKRPLSSGACSIRAFEARIGRKRSDGAHGEGLALAGAREQAAAHANLAGVEQHPPGPAVHIEVLNQASHAAHPLALLGRRHHQSRPERRRTLIDVVRVDDQGLRKLARGAGELAEDEHAALIVARSDEFLGHQVHPVVQAADDTHVRRPVVLINLVGVVMLDAQQDGSTALAGEPFIDAARLRAHSRVEILVLVDARARGSGDLHEDELPDPQRIDLQHALDGEEALQDSLGVVEPVDADADDGVRREPVFRAYVGPALRDRFLHGLGGERPFDRYRIATHGGLVAAVGHRISFPVDACLDVAVDRVDEVVAVELGVESENAAPEETVDQLLAPGADAEGLRVRPGNVPERDDGRRRDALADHARQQRE